MIALSFEWCAVDRMRLRNLIHIRKIIGNNIHRIIRAYVNMCTCNKVDAQQAE